MSGWGELRMNKVWVVEIFTGHVTARGGSTGASQPPWWGRRQGSLDVGPGYLFQLWHVLIRKEKKKWNRYHFFWKQGADCGAATELSCNLLPNVWVPLGFPQLFYGPFSKISVKIRPTMSASPTTSVKNWTAFQSHVNSFYKKHLRFTKRKFSRGEFIAGLCPLLQYGYHGDGLTNSLPLVNRTMSSKYNWIS